MILMNQPVSDDGITVEAVGQNTEHISDVPDDSALTDPSLEEPVLHTHFSPILIFPRKNEYTLSFPPGKMSAY